nr:MAG TPA: hypothetical protein [Herelleviridae sp.]
MAAVAGGRQRDTHRAHFRCQSIQRLDTARELHQGQDKVCSELVPRLAAEFGHQRVVITSNPGCDELRGQATRSVLHQLVQNGGQGNRLHAKIPFQIAMKELRGSGQKNRLVRYRMGVRFWCGGMLVLYPRKPRPSPRRGGWRQQFGGKAKGQQLFPAFGFRGNHEIVPCGCKGPAQIFGCGLDGDVVVFHPQLQLDNPSTVGGGRCGHGSFLLPEKH